MLLDDIVEQAYQKVGKRPEAAYEELGNRFFDPISKEIGARILKCGPKVPVLTGKCSLNGNMNSRLTRETKASLELCQVLCLEALAADILIFVLQCVPLGSVLESFRFGRKWTGCILQILPKSPRRDFLPQLHQKKQPS